MSITTKEGTQFTQFTAAGLCILQAIAAVSTSLGLGLVITSACDGTHSGPEDPHHLGNAYDVRSKDLVDKDSILLSIMKQLPGGDPQPQSGGFVTEYFFGWIEDAGGENEHFHFQLRKGVTFNIST